MREEILSKIHTNQVIVLVGETGCGKTTQVCVCVCLSLCSVDRHFQESILCVCVWEGGRDKTALVS